VQFLKCMGIDISQFQEMMQSTGTNFDPYWILKLDRSASDEEVKKRYRELIGKLHPDKSGTEGTNSLFQMVLAAYEMIKKERGWQ
jgi:DnaJ-class molecular chaperone